MSITSDEVTFLILRYFKECGFEHSHYTYANESSIDSSSITGYQIPPGALITLLQKGLLYIQLERSIAAGNAAADLGMSTQITLLNAALREGSTQTGKDPKSNQGDKNEASVPLDPSNSIPLSEHTANVICCQWSKDGNFLATGSTDNSAIIWDFRAFPSVSQCHLPHGDENSKEGDHQVSTLDWSPDGNLLATGCSDGAIHVYNKSGVQLYEKAGKEGRSVHVVRFDPTGQRLLVGSASTKIKIYAADSGDKIRSIEMKDQTQILDAAWRTADSFAVSREDGAIGILKAIDAEPQWLTGHAGAVNSIVWEPGGEGLASCSDDNTVRVWREGEDPLVLKGHTSPVYAIRWSAGGVLASASFDYTVRLWNPLTGECTHTLEGHQKPIYALAFSPDERFVVSGSFDQTIKFWDVRTGALIVTCLGKQNIYDLQFDENGERVAVCFERGDVVIIQTAQVLQGTGAESN